MQFNLHFHSLYSLTSFVVSTSCPINGYGQQTQKIAIKNNFRHIFQHFLTTDGIQNWSIFKFGCLDRGLVVLCRRVRCSATKKFSMNATTCSIFWPTQSQTRKSQNRIVFAGHVEGWSSTLPHCLFLSGAGAHAHQCNILSVWWGVTFSEYVFVALEHYTITMQFGQSGDWVTTAQQLVFSRTPRSINAHAWARAVSTASTRNVLIRALHQLSRRCVLRQGLLLRGCWFVPLIQPNHPGSVNGEAAIFSVVERSKRALPVSLYFSKQHY